MGWNHLVFEGHCLYRNDDGEIPVCCLFKPGNVGVHCLDSKEGNQTRCRYFAYSKARSTIVLTDITGNAVAFQTFWSEEDRENNVEWDRKEKEWIKKLKEKIESDNI